MEKNIPATEYYNEIQDEQDKENYYQGINTGTTLFNDLQALLTDTHHNQPGYAPSTHLYPFVDLHPDQLIRSIYSGKEFTVEELILLDAKVDEERQLEIVRLTQQESQMTKESFQLALEDIELTLPYNCEHVVPQS